MASEILPACSSFRASANSAATLRDDCAEDAAGASCGVAGGARLAAAEVHTNAARQAWRNRKSFFFSSIPEIRAQKYRPVTRRVTAASLVFRGRRDSLWQSAGWDRSAMRARSEPLRQRDAPSRQGPRQDWLQRWRLAAATAGPAGTAGPRLQNRSAEPAQGQGCSERQSNLGGLL